MGAQLVEREREWHRLCSGYRAKSITETFPINQYVTLFARAASETYSSPLGGGGLVYYYSQCFLKKYGEQHCISGYNSRSSKTRKCIVYLNFGYVANIMSLKGSHISDEVWGCYRIWLQYSRARGPPSKTDTFFALPRATAGTHSRKNGGRIMTFTVFGQINFSLKTQNMEIESY